MSSHNILITKEADLHSRINLAYFTEIQAGLTPLMRNKVVTWMLHLNSIFDLSAETFFVSVDLLDRVLSRLRVHPRYLQLIAVAVYWIASKMKEETETLPILRELVINSDHNFSANDIIRMESIVLSKLEWDLRTVTPYAMLVSLTREIKHKTQYHGSGIFNCGDLFYDNDLAILSLAQRHLETFVCSDASLPFLPSMMVAVALAMALKKHSDVQSYDIPSALNYNNQVRPDNRAFLLALAGVNGTDASYQRCEERLETLSRHVPVVYA